MEKFVESIKSRLYHEFAVFADAARTLKNLSCRIGDEYTVSIIAFDRKSDENSQIVIQCNTNSYSKAYKFDVWFSSYGSDINIVWDSFKEVKPVEKVVQVWEEI